MEKQENFDQEPVAYCAKCYSLNIIHEEVIDSDCCGECGCSDIRTTSIDEWEKMYVNRYKHKFVETNHDVRKSPIFLLPLEKLKLKVYNNSEWRDICKTLYPTFPDGLSKTDSTILLFAKLVQENRIDDLRLELINRNKKR